MHRTQSILIRLFAATGTFVGCLDAEDDHFADGRDRATSVWDGELVADAATVGPVPPEVAAGLDAVFAVNDK